MILIWLLLPAVSAIIDCRSACDLCKMDKDPATRYVTCALCRKCQQGLNPRRMMELQLPNREKIIVEGQVLNKSQQEDLKKAELNEFKQVMKDYGWKPEDLTTVDDGLVVMDEEDNDEQCVDQVRDCLELINEESHKKSKMNKQLLKHHKHRTSSKCPVYRRPKCPSTTPVTPRNCPPVRPCTKKKRTPKNKVTNPDSEASTSASDKLRRMILRQLDLDLDAIATEDGCPTQPVCSDEESDVEVLSYTGSVITPPPLTSTITTAADKPCKTLESTPCMPCMPPCPLPCYPQMLLPPPTLPPAWVQPPPMPLPTILPSIPQEALEALMTLKPAKANKQITQKSSETQSKITKKIKSDEDSNTAEESEDESPTREERTTKESHSDVMKLVGTSKDYLYLYVGIPKNVKDVRKG